MKKHILNLSLLCLFFTGCFKQSPPPLAPDSVRGINDLVRLEACSNLSLNENFLTHKNILALFECTKWDGQFKQLYRSIKSINPNSWEVIFKDIGSEFFDNRARRDRMITSLRRLDSVGALDDLGFVITALNDTNFYNSINEFFICAKTPRSPSCRNRQLQGLTQEDFTRSLALIKQSDEVYLHIIELLKKTIQVVGNDEQLLKNVIVPFYRADEFQSVRIEIADQLVSKLSRGFSADEISFLKRMLSPDGQEDLIFLYELIQAQDMNEQVFTELARYLIDSKPELISDIRLLSDAVLDGASCLPASSNHYLLFKFENEINEISRVIEKGIIGDFFRTVLAKISLLKTAESFCPIIRQYARNQNSQKKLDFLKLLNDVSDYARSPLRFDLLSFLARSGTSESQTGGMFLIDLISSDLFRASNGVNEIISNRSVDFYAVIFKLLRRMPKETFENLLELLNGLNESDQRERLEAFGRLWSFFTFEEKNYLFKFVDRHLDEQTQYLQLFRFYVELLEEFFDVRGKVIDGWIRDEQAELKFLSGLEDLSRYFAGPEVLSDFRKFFSRDHIIEVIRVITKGVALQEEARRELGYIYNERFITEGSQSRFSIRIPAPADLISCLDDFSKNDRTIYDLINEMPTNCRRYMNDDGGLIFISWLSDIQKDYRQFFGQDYSLFSQSGVLKPSNLNSMMLLISTADKKVDGGFEYLNDSFLFHLYEKKRHGQNGNGYLYFLENSLSLLNESMLALPSSSETLRGALIKKITLLDTDEFQLITNRFIEQLGLYGNWLDTWTKKPVASSNPLTCSNYLSQRIGYKCPRNAGEVLSPLKDALTVMNRKVGDSRSSVIDLLFDAFRVNGGLRIPLNSSSGSLYRMSLKETFEMLHRKTDKKRAINQLRTPYQEKNTQAEVNRVITTAERIEVVIRDVQFGKNYLGVQYMNMVAQGDNYNDDVQNRKDLLRNCIRVPVLRCGRRMPDDEKRQAQNALASFDGLLDANNGRSTDSSFTFGNYMKTLLTAIVGSSNKESQEVQLLPLKDEMLDLHNGVALGHITRLAGLSHMGRWIHDRIGQSNEDLAKFINSYSFQHLDKTLFADYPVVETKALASRVVSLLLKDQGGISILSDLIDWIYKMNRSELIELEETVGKLIIIFSHIGPAELIINSNDPRFDSYRENSQFELLELIELFLSDYKNIRSAKPISFDLREIIVKNKKSIDFLYQQLQTNEKRDQAYIFINDLVGILRNLLIIEHRPASIVDIGLKPATGKEILKKMLQNQSLLTKIYEWMMDFDSYSETLSINSSGEVSGDWYSEISSNLKILRNSEEVSLQELNEYFMLTSKNVICNRDLQSCEANPHYDELYRLSVYMSSKTSGKTRLANALEQYKLKKQNINDFIKQILQSVEIRSE